MQPHFDPEAHGLSKSESYDDMPWNEIFADELKDMINRERTVKPSFMNEDDEIFHGHFEAVPDWPTSDFPVGQVGGLATDDKGQLHIFHRANRVWGPEYDYFRIRFLFSYGALHKFSLSMMHYYYLKKLLLLIIPDD